MADLFAEGFLVGGVVGLAAGGLFGMILMAAFSLKGGQDQAEEWKQLVEAYNQVVTERDILLGDYQRLAARLPHRTVDIYDETGLSVQMTVEDEA